MKTKTDPLGNFQDRCRKAGLKATHQRLEIFRELAATAAHPDAETIYRRVKKRIPAMSFDTVYRTLRTLEEKGLITRAGTPIDRFRFDANLKKHHHFVCTNCGSIRDFTSSRFDGLEAPKDAKELGLPQSIHVEVRGLCKDCRGKSKQP